MKLNSFNCVIPKLFYREPYFKRHLFMMKYLYLTIIFLFAQIASSEEINDQSFIGKWCGKWDEIYSMCLTIENIDPGSTAKYQWLEHESGKFKRDEKQIKRINRNTLKIDNIWFVLDENNLGKASAMGVFRVQTRMAGLVRNLEKSSPPK